MASDQIKFGPDCIKESFETKDGFKGDVVGDEFVDNSKVNDTMHPQDREEYLRDVIAVMHGQESPGFHHDQNAVQADAKRRLAEHPKKRHAINAAEKEWQEAKAQAANLHKQV